MGSEQPAPETDPRAAAQRLVALLPLREIFQDRELADAFLSELMLALARESSREARRELQRKGIAQAKAQGVRFGKPARPLPENFDEVRFAWRRGEFNLITAAQLCGMPKSTFHSAVQEAEKMDSKEGCAAREAKEDICGAIGKESESCSA